MKTIDSKELSLDTCMEMFNAAKVKADEIGFKIALTIVDTGGNTKFFARMDGGALVACDISRKKAVTAVGFGIPTGNGGWYDFIKGDPILENGVSNIKDFMLLGGGKPISIDGQLVGAIGISGGHYTQDEACCDAALAIL